MNGTLKIRIDGLNSSKIINALVDEGVLIKNMITKSKASIFEISENDELKLKHICKRFHKAYMILSKNNIINFLKRLRYYIGFTCAVVLVGMLCFWSNLYVYKVNVSIDGEGDFNLENIISILNENGISSGVRIKDFNISEIQKRIIASQKNISSCTIKKNGGILDVIIYPGVLKEDASKENIYSKYNAVITDVKIYAGKSNVKVGDLVKEGDLLIENNNGASGLIKGKIYFSDYILYNENQIVKEKTGNEYCDTRILIFNKIINKGVKNIKFTNYFEENCVFCVSNNIFLPINLIKTKYEEFEYKESIVKFSEVEDELKQKLYNDVLSKLSKECDITNVTYSIVNENNLTRLDCFVECEINLLS